MAHGSVRANKLCLAIALSTLGCAAEAASLPPPQHGSPGPGSDEHPSPSPSPSQPGPAVPQLATHHLEGPAESPAKACEKAAGLAAVTPPGAPCTVTPIALPAGAPFEAALLRVEDKRDARYAGSGVFFLAVGKGTSWYFEPKPLAQINGAAGKTYLPVLTLIEAAYSGRTAPIHLRETTAAVCNVCEGPERDKRTPVAPRGMVIACGHDKLQRPACTQPMEVDDKAKVTVDAEGRISIASPGAATKTFEPKF